MTDDTSRADLHDRLDELEARLEADRKQYRSSGTDGGSRDERRAATAGDVAGGSDRRSEGRGERERSRAATRLSRRQVLTALGAAGVAGLGVGNASAATGRIGTTDDPLTTVYTDELNGPATGGQSVTSLTGNALEIGNVNGTVVDDFEGDLSAYGGDTGSASIVSSPVQHGSSALKLVEDSGAKEGINSTTGLSRYPHQGDTFRAWVRTDDNDGFVYLQWGVQSEASPENAKFYRATLSRYTQKLRLQRKISSPNNAETYAEASQSYSDFTWYEIAVDWATDGTMTVTLFDANGTQLNQISGTDTTYDSGGIGFTTRPRTGKQVNYFDYYRIVEDGPNSPWVDSDGDGLLELDGKLTSYTGVDVAAVEPGHLDVKHTLQTYSDVGNDVTRTTDALSMLFSETAWADGTYRSGPAHGEGSAAFNGAALAPTGEVVFAPQNSSNVGVYDPADDSYTSADSHGEGSKAFYGAALAPTGEVVFAPDDSPNVGRYDPSAGTYTSGAAHSAGTTNAFIGAALAPTGDVVFASHVADEIGVYDPSADTYSSGPTHGEGNDTFFGTSLAPTGDVILVPDNSNNVGVYDPSADTYSSGDSHGEGNAAFSGAAVAPTGDVVFAPFDSSDVGVYDPSTDTYSSGPSHGEGSAAFSGAVVAPTGEVVFAPYQSSNVGVYDPSTDMYTSGPSHGETTPAFRGATLTPSGRIVFAPADADNVGIYDAFAKTSNPRSTALHPLVNTS